jgi:hypothetical protein
MLMGMPMLDFPRPIADLCADLAGQGFDILDERAGAELILVLQGPVKVDGQWLEAFVRLAQRERQWSISVRFDGMASWVAAQTWAAYLDGTDPDQLDLVHRTRFVRYRLPEAARAIRATPQAERVLVQLAEGGPRPG